MDILDAAKTRYTAKSFTTRKIPPETVAKLRQLLQLSPSSTNTQPWRFVIAESDAAKAQVAKAAERFPFNVPSIQRASHVVVFASLLEANEDYLLKVLAQEEADGRFVGDPEGFKTGMHNARSMFVDLHQVQLKDGAEWFAKQLYLNLGQFLLGVAALGLDATAMEGIDFDLLDQELGLREAGYHAHIVVPVGYADPETDHNRSLPKSRLPESEIIELR